MSDSRMNFRQIKDKIIEILGSYADDRFRVVGYQKQIKNASEMRGILRTAQVYYAAGDFPKGKSALTGPVQHECTFRIDLTCAEAAAGDLATIKSDSATAAQKANKLLAFQSASERCDCSIDELADIIYQILMDGRNIDVGMPIGQVASRWVSRIEKDDIEDSGELVTLTGSMDFTLNTEEQILGDTSGVEGDLVHDVTLDIDGDDTERTATKVTLGGS